MNALVHSRHAEQRMGQRGIRPSGLDLVLRHGSIIDGDTHAIYFLKSKDAQREIERLNNQIRYLKRDIQMLERMRGVKVVVADGTVVTCYRSNQRDQKRISRRARRNHNRDQR